MRVDSSGMRICVLKKMPALLSVVCAAVLVCLSPWVSLPWCDELTFVDSGVNFLRTGHWQSNVFYLVNNPGFSIVSALVMSVFGRSHQVVSLVTVGCALWASLGLNRSLRMRGLLRSVGEETLFTILFWSGWHMIWIVVNGRPDTLTMALLVLLWDALVPPDGGRTSGLRIAARACLLMCVSAYALPITVLALVGLGLFSPGRRRAYLVKAIAVVVGAGAAWGAIALFYAYHHEVVRFLGFYACFNTITGGSSVPLLTRIARAYTFDYFALAVLAGSLALVPFAQLPRRRTFLVGLLVALVPCVMVGCGRYEFYYSWLLSVPVCVYAAFVLSRTNRCAMKVGCALAALAFAARLVWSVSVSDTAVARHAQAAEFVARHGDDLCRERTVLVADDTVGDVSFYYPLMARGVDLWFRGKAVLSEMTDREKFEVGLKSFVPDESRRREILERVLEHQNVLADLPSGEFLVLYPSAATRKDVEPILKKKGCRTLRCLAEEDGISLVLIVRESETESNP